MKLPSNNIERIEKRRDPICRGWKNCETVRRTRTGLSQKVILKNLHRGSYLISYQPVDFFLLNKKVEK